MTISCTSQNEVDGSIGNTCASNGSKTATVTSVNNSSSDVYYLIEYALEQNPSNWLSVTDSFGLPTQGSKDDLVNLPEGSYFTLRYKTSTSNSFTGVEYKTLETLGPVNCSGDIEVRVALDACVDGARNSVFYYRNRASTGAPAFFEIEYQIDADPGGLIPAWLAKMASRDIPLKTLVNLRNRVKKTAQAGTYKKYIDSVTYLRESDTK